MNKANKATNRKQLSAPSLNAPLEQLMTTAMKTIRHLLNRLTASPKHHWGVRYLSAPRLSRPTLHAVRAAFCLLFLSPAFAKSVLLVDFSGSPIYTYLVNQGHNVTSATAAEMASISFAPFDTIILPQRNYGTAVFPGRNGDFIAFANRGGVLHIELAGNSDAMADLPNASGIVAVTGLGDDAVQITAPGHPINAGLSDAGLSNWGQSIHVAYSSTGSGVEIQRDGNRGQALTLDVVQGSGHFIYTGLHAIAHAQTQGYTFINNIANLGSGAVLAAPSVTAESARNITQTAAELYGSVNPNGATTQYQFQYGITAALGQQTSLTSIGGGTSAVGVSNTITGLQPGTRYYYRLRASNSAGITDGTIFSLDTPAPPAVHTFTGAPAEGANPSAGLIVGTDGRLYGTTLRGGANNGVGSTPPGDGTVYQVIPGVTASVSKLSDFNQNAPSQVGAWPVGPIVESGGQLFGACILGGTQGKGTLWKCDLDGTDLVRVYDFLAGGAGGEGPGGLTDGGDGWLYGITSDGASNGNGAIYRISASGPHTLEPKSSFNTGRGKSALVRGAVGELFGLCNTGGTYNRGYLYRYTVAGGLEIRQHFGSAGDTDPNGAYPTGKLALRSGLIYGTTSHGGANGLGVIFSYRISDGAFSVVHSFAAGEGTEPRGLAASGDLLYGAMQQGGPNDKGTVYAVTANGNLVLLHVFAGAEGQYPAAPPTLAPDGRLYGVCSNGGGLNFGTVYQLNAPQAPLVTTEPVTNLDATDVTLNGTVNPSGFESSATFIVAKPDLSDAYAFDGTPTTIPAGNSPVAVTANFPWTEPHQAISVRMYGSNSVGFTYGHVVQVVRPNRAPVAASDDGGRVFAGQSVNVAVLGNDSDDDGDTLAVDSVGAADRGTVEISGGAITYTAPNTGGPDSFTYTLSDGFGGFDTATVTILVIADPVRTVLASKNGVVPGAGVDPQIGATAVWASFGVPAINDDGNVGFLGSWKEGVKFYSGIFTGPANAPVLKAKNGASAPSVANAVFSTLTDPLLADDGAVAWRGTIANTPGTSGAVTTATNQGIWLDPDAQGPILPLLIVRKGAEPAGVPDAQWKAFTSVALGESMLAFTGTMVTGLLGAPGPGGVTTANDNGLWVYNRDASTLALVLREGDAMLGSIVQTISVFVARPGSPGQGRGVDSAFAVLRLTLADKRQAIGFVGWDGPSVAPLYTAGEGAVAYDAGAPPLWASFGLPTQNTGAAFAFLGTVKTAVGGPSTANNVALYAEDDANFVAARVVTKGDPAPGVVGGTFGGFQDPVSALNRSLAFRGTLATSTAAGISTANNLGLWWRNGAGVLNLLARKGALAAEAEPAAVIPAGVEPLPKWSGFTSLALPEGTTGPLFVASLINKTPVPIGSPALPGPGGVTTATDVGLWGVDSLGAVRLLLREGDAIGASTVKTFTVLTAVTGSPAQTRSFNDNGQVIVRVTDATGAQHLLRIDVP